MKTEKTWKLLNNKIDIYDDKIELLEWTVFNKEKKKDAFEDMYEKIAQQASEIK